MLPLALLLIIPLAASASPLEEVFGAYVKVRKAEEEMRLESKEEMRQKMAAHLTEAKIGFHDSLAAHEKWEPWEKSLLQKIEKRSTQERAPPPETKAMGFLQASFPRPKELSPLEWQAIGEWFGPDIQERFLRDSFALRELREFREPREAAAASAKAAENRQLVWVKDPFRKLLENSDSLERAELEKIDPSLITIEISAFSKIDDQAEELRHAVLSLGDKHFVLVSDGEASAVVMKMLDLYPSLRERENITGWVNVNGRLYGRAEANEKAKAKKPSRSPASVANQLSEEALSSLRGLRMESLVRGTPLGEGFPIVNILSLDKNRRPAANLREALVAEGSSWFVQGSAAKRVRSAIPLLSPR